MTHICHLAIHKSIRYACELKVGPAVAAEGSLWETSASKIDVGRLQEDITILKIVYDWCGETIMVGSSSTVASLR